MRRSSPASEACGKPEACPLPASPSVRCSKSTLCHTGIQFTTRRIYALVPSVSINKQVNNSKQSMHFHQLVFSMFTVTTCHLADKQMFDKNPGQPRSSLTSSLSTGLNTKLFHQILVANNDNKKSSLRYGNNRHLNQDTQIVDDNDHMHLITQARCQPGVHTNTCKQILANNIIQRAIFLQEFSKTVSQNYSPRPRAHDTHLPDLVSRLVAETFIKRMLYRNVY